VPLGITLGQEKALRSIAINPNSGRAQARSGRACDTELAMIDSGCAAPMRSAGNPGHAPGSSRSANDRVCCRNDAVDAGDGHLFPDFKAERTDNGCEQKDSNTLDHAFHSFCGRNSQSNVLI
jgi:hypothetical protein